MREILRHVLAFIPALIVLALTIAATSLTRRLLASRASANPENRFKRQLLTLLVTLSGLMFLILVLPIGDSSRAQLLTLLGVLLSAAIAFSSTTIIGNALAGFVLHSIRHFQIGDFIEVGTFFGRVSERGVFHTEIQTEQRELVTLSNLYMVGNPVTVFPQSGTIVWAEVSLGYDVPRKGVEQALLDAAVAAGFEKPFVQIRDLGDHSVTYRINGLLTDLSRLIFARSQLRAQMLDTLHHVPIEIVSPAFMNLRQLPLGEKIIPPALDTRAAQEPRTSAPPDLFVFDKADRAKTRAELLQMLDAMSGKIKELSEEASASISTRAAELELQITAVREQQERLRGFLAQHDDDDSE